MYTYLTYHILGDKAFLDKKELHGEEAPHERVLGSVSLKTGSKQ